MVGRYSAPDLQLDPTMAWSAFYETEDGRIIGSRERHGQFLPTSRYVNVEGNRILDPDGLDDAMSRLDLDTLLDNSNFYNTIIHPTHQCFSSEKYSKPPGLKTQAILTRSTSQT